MGFNGLDYFLLSRFFIFHFLFVLFLLFFFLRRDENKPVKSFLPLTAEGHFDGSEAFGVSNVIIDLYKYFIWREYVCILKKYYFCDAFVSYNGHVKDLYLCSYHTCL